MTHIDDFIISEIVELPKGCNYKLVEGIPVLIVPYKGKPIRYGANVAGINLLVAGWGDSPESAQSDLTDAIIRRLDDFHTNGKNWIESTKKEMEKLGRYIVLDRKA